MLLIILHVELLLHFLRVSRITLRGELLSFALIFCMTCILFLASLFNFLGGVIYTKMAPRGATALQRVNQRLNERKTDPRGAISTFVRRMTPLISKICCKTVAL